MATRRHPNQKEVTTKPYAGKKGKVKGNSLFEGALMQLGIDFDVGRMLLAAAIKKVGAKIESVTIDDLHAALPEIEERLALVAPEATAKATMSRLRLFLRRVGG